MDVPESVIIVTGFGMLSNQLGLDVPGEGADIGDDKARFHT